FAEKLEEAGETSAAVKPQGQIQQQLAEAEMQNTATAFPYRKYPQGLPSQSHNDRQQKPRNDSH
ncbi:transposase, partial [Escherichia coli]